MLELLILLPFIMMTILSMTFQVSVDELYNASRGNYFKYSAPEIDHHHIHSGREKLCDPHQKKRVVINISGTPSLSSRRLITSKKPLLPAEGSKLQTCYSGHFDVASLLLLGDRSEIIFLNRIITKLGEEMVVPAFLSLDYGCSCALTKEDCSSNQVFNPTTCRCEHQSSERAENTRKAPDAIGCNCICPLHISQIYSTDPFFHPESHQYVPSDSFSGSRNRRPV